MNEHVSAEPLAGYRPCVGIFLLNANKQVFVGNRANTDREAWQFPQGGIDRGELPEAAALREMCEEIGTKRAHILKVSACWRSYDLPADIAARMWRGRYRGQTQKWIALAFDGEDDEIVLDAHHQEFESWRWIDPTLAVDLAISFKREIYQSVIDEFRPLWDATS